MPGGAIKGLGGLEAVDGARAGAGAYEGGRGEGTATEMAARATEMAARAAGASGSLVAFVRLLSISLLRFRVGSTGICKAGTTYVSHSSSAACSPLATGMPD